MKKLFSVMLAVVSLAVFASIAEATNDCTFTDTGSEWMLEGNCTTDTTILIPDEYTLNGMGYTITGVDPVASHFVGAVVANDGEVANVTRLNVTVSELSNTCDGGATRLRGIMFEGASGSITHTTVDGINQGPSGCQEGNAIEIRQEPFDGEHPATKTVDINHVTVTNYQKTGIIVNGDVEVNISHSYVGSSATQANLAANSIQYGYGALGKITQNTILGNEWLGTSNWASTAVLIYLANDLVISNNNIRGNSEIGIYNYGDRNTIDNNRVFDEGEDLATHNYDYGIGNWGADSVITNNKVKGFDFPYDGVDGGNNKSVGSPQPDNDWF